MLYLKNKKFETIDIIEDYDSLIWTERFNEKSDFELNFKNVKDISKFKNEPYLVSDFSKKIMIPEKIEITYSIDGYDTKITGSSVEYNFLKKRIIWTQTSLKGNTNYCIKKILMDNVILPNDSSRKLPIFFKESTNRLARSNIIEAQYTGDTVYSAISDICKTSGVGFELILNQNNLFFINILTGIDKTGENNNPDTIIFSSKYDSLKNSNYIYSISDYGNVALVAGEGEGINRKSIIVGDNTKSGFDRFELYVDARDLSSNNGEISTSQYNNILSKRGNEKLKLASINEAVDGECVSESYIYGVDYNLGDVVKLQTNFGINVNKRISEYIYSFDSNGMKQYPTLSDI